MKFLKKLKYVITLGIITASCSVMASPYGDSDVLFGCIIKGKTTKEAGQDHERFLLK
ncbi:hypothetical protein VSX61_21890 [Brenneria populi subsp. brevivirga]|uniref:hypothetical protein n=1 Tax=Brenneria populi TaxID=1505588 RepID=UPI002E17D137|nr:hypothetical protein [Brenneria populi subsp. brevivirga]